MKKNIFILALLFITSDSNGEPIESVVNKTNWDRKDLSQVGINLYHLAEEGNESTITKILYHKDSIKIDGVHLANALFVALRRKHEHAANSIFNLLLSNVNATSGILLWFPLLRRAAGNGKEEVIFYLLKNINKFTKKEINLPFNYEDQRISKADAYYSMTDSAITGNHVNIIKYVLESDNFNQETQFKNKDHLLLWLIIYSVEMNNLKILQELLNNNKFTQALSSLEDGGYFDIKIKKIINEGSLSSEIIKNYRLAYTALKNNAYDKGVDQDALVAQLIGAYEDFKDGKPDYLRNLIFPISHGVGSVLAPSSQQHIDLLSNEIRELFKPECIQPLLFLLVETKGQKQFAMDFLRQNGFLHSQIFGEPATKIQKTFRGYKARKDLAQQKQKANLSTALELALKIKI